MSREKRRLICCWLALVCLVLIAYWEPLEILLSYPEDRNTFYLEAILKGPPPDYEKFVEGATSTARATPASYSESQKGFDDLLKIRESADAAAVPLLEEIMERLQGSGRIHHYVAIQALFGIGTPEAHRVLSRYVLTARHPARQGIEFAFSYDLKPRLRDRLIERYYLHNLTEDVQLELSAKRAASRGQTSYHFLLTVHNQSPKSFMYSAHTHFRGFLLYFRDARGRFIRSFQTSTVCGVTPKYESILPGKSGTISIGMALRPVDELEYRHPAISQSADWVLETNEVLHDIRRRGRFTVYAMVESPPMTAQWSKHWGVDDPWVGRAVSKPLRITLR